MPWQARRKPGLSKTSSGGTWPSRTQAVGAVQVGEHGVEERRALDHRALDLRPLVPVDGERHQIHRPRPRAALRIAVDVVGDAVGANQLLAELPAPRELVAAPCGAAPRPAASSAAAAGRRDRALRPSARRAAGGSSSPPCATDGSRRCRSRPRSDPGRRGRARRSGAGGRAWTGTRGCRPSPASAARPACGRTRRTGPAASLPPRWSLQEGSRSSARPGGRRGRCSRRSTRRAPGRPRRTPAACGPESSGAGSAAAARRGSARRTTYSPSVPVGCSGSCAPLHVTREPLGHEASHLHLQPLDRRVDVARGAAAARLFAQHVPRLDRLPQLHVHAVVDDAAVDGEAELEVRREPGARRSGSRRGAGRRSPSRNRARTKCGSRNRSCSRVPQRIGAARRTALARTRRAACARSSCCARLMRACGGISKARISTRPRRPGGAVGRIQLVDAELGPVRVAGDVDQQIAEDAVHQPRRTWRAFARLPIELLERDLQLVDGVGAGFVHARRLARGADEHAGEQIRQRRVIEPVADQLRSRSGRRRTGCRPASARRARRGCRRRCRCGGRRA